MRSTDQFESCHHSQPDRDFFPVILTFLRQLPVIGNLLQLPYIRDVSCPACVLIRRAELVHTIGCRSHSRLPHICRIIMLSYLYTESHSITLHMMRRNRQCTVGGDLRPIALPQVLPNIASRRQISPSVMQTRVVSFCNARLGLYWARGYETLSS